MIDVRKFRFSAIDRSISLPLLVEAARYGDESAYHELINRTYKSVKSYCSVMGTSAECEDLAQEVYVRALRGNTPMLSTENVEAFMITIAKFVCADYIKSKQKVKTLNTKLKNTYEEGQLIPETEADLEMLEHLGSDQKQIVLLAVILGFSYDEISEILALPIGTVRSRLSRAKEKLKNQIIHGTNSNQLMTS